MEDQGSTAISNCTFRGNQASTSGSAVYAGGTSTLDISDTTLANNNASYGAAVFMFNNASLSIDSSTCSRNTATTSGGCLGVDGSNVGISWLDTLLHGCFVGRNLQQCKPSLHEICANAKHAVAHNACTTSLEQLAERSACLVATAEAAITSYSAPPEPARMSLQCGLAWQQYVISMCARVAATTAGCASATVCIHLQFSR